MRYVSPVFAFPVTFDYMKIPLKIIFVLLWIITSSATIAGGIYQEPAAFIDQVFDNKPPKAEVLWLDKTLKEKMAGILGHNYIGLRVRYWQQDKKSAWVLEEIGKEKPITAGIVINNGKIEQLKILAFRESRGWEVRHDFFTGQFTQASLKDDQQLDKNIDNISGATLSVRAVSKLARIALLLDQQIQ